MVEISGGLCALEAVRGKNGRKYVNQSISFTPELLQRVKGRALAHGLSLSHYVRLCIKREMDSFEPVLYIEREVAEPVEPVTPPPPQPERKAEEKNQRVTRRRSGRTGA